jgi:hypothetical protein
MRTTLATAILLACASQAAAIGDSFTYQGQLDDNGVAANGAYDLQFALISEGNVLDTRTLDDVAVSNGVFSVDLVPVRRTTPTSR